MKTEYIGRQFAAMGARLKVTELPVNRWRNNDYAIDIQHDRRGEFFELRVPKELAAALDLAVLQSDKEDRHLLMLVRNARNEKQRDRYLCGHDERAWFVAAVPKRVSTVPDAKEALKPRPVLHAQSQRGLSAKERHLRRNSVFVRQGEWFFLPEPRLVVARAKDILRNEPIRRGSGKAHVVQEVVRSGGQVVYVSSTHPNGITEAQYRKLIQDPAKARLNWRIMRAGAAVYARGTVRHPDHKTIFLPGWHRVLMNTEHESPWMPRVAFLD